MHVFLLNMKDFLQLTPLLVFILLYSFVNFTMPDISYEIKNGLTLAFAFLSSFYAILIFPKKENTNKISFFLKGMGQESVQCMTLIFFLSSIFSYNLEKTGSIQSAIAIGQELIPASFLLPGLFLTIALFSTALGSSMGGIAAFTPFALELSRLTDYDPALLGGIVVGASMLGDNLSLISDTTIAATTILGQSMKEKFRFNIKLTFFSTLITIAILMFFYPANTDFIIQEKKGIGFQDIILILPYLSILVLAFFNVHVIALLFFGNLMSGGIGLFFGKITLIEFLSSFFLGPMGNSGIIHVIFLVLIISGMAFLIQESKSIENITSRFLVKMKRRELELSSALLVFVLDLFLAVNTLAILMSGPIVKKWHESADEQERPKLGRLASILDIFSCIPQGLAPYMPQMLLCSTLLGINPTDLLAHSHYQYSLAVVTLVSIFFSR